MPSPVERFYLVLPLTETSLSAPVEVIYAGTFHLADRNRVLELTEPQLDEMVENFHRLEESGRIPVNVNHHSHAGTLDEARAVGWMVDLAKEPTREGERLSLMATPQWLEDAREAIAKEEFKFLSAEIVFADTDYRTGQPIGCHLRGVALTNTPAIPDLTPITLTRLGSDEDRQVRIAATLGRLHLNDSLMERVREIITAFYAAFWDTETTMRCVEDVREEDLIVCEMAMGAGMEHSLWSVPYTEADGAFTFALRDQWVEVEQVYQPKAPSVAPGPDAMAATLRRPGDAPPPVGSIAANGGVKMGASAPAILSSAAGRGTNPQEQTMDELLKLLGLSADGDVMTAVRGLLAQVTALTSQRDGLQTQLTQAQAQTTDLTTKSAQVETLTTKVAAYEAEMQRLAGQVTELTKAQRTRETHDRIDLALRQGRTTPAELDGQEGFLRSLASSQPETFEKLMALRPERPDLFTQIGSNGDPAPVAATGAEAALDAMFAEIERLAQEKKIEFEVARQQVLAEHPEWKALTIQKEGE